MARLGVLVVLFLGGCVVDVGPQCSKDTDCAEGQMCNKVGLCRAPPDSGCVEGPACYEGPAGTEGVGQCHGGQLGCVNGAPVCEGAVVPTLELVCDGLDDDCDGQTDEGIGSVPEECNGVDDDCDGRVDEHIEQPECELTKGVCADIPERNLPACVPCGGEAQPACVREVDLKAWTACVYPETYQAEDVCGVDNNCDGVVGSCPGDEIAAATNFRPAMLFIPATGPDGFLMGSPEDEEGRYPDQELQHSVVLTRAYLMGRTEVTNAQWDAMAVLNDLAVTEFDFAPSPGRGCADCPLENSQTP